MVFHNIGSPVNPHECNTTNWLWWFITAIEVFCKSIIHWHILTLLLLCVLHVLWLSSCLRLNECEKLKPLRTQFFWGNKKHTFTFYVIPPHWYNTGYNTGGWNPSSNKTRTYPFYRVNIVVAGVLATQGARPSAAMLLTQLNRDNSVPAS